MKATIDCFNKCSAVAKLKVALCGGGVREEYLWSWYRTRTHSTQSTFVRNCSRLSCPFRPYILSKRVLWDCIDSYNLVIGRPTSQQFYNYLRAAREPLKKLCKIYLKLGTICGTSDFALISPFPLSPNFKVKDFWDFRFPYLKLPRTLKLLMENFNIAETSLCARRLPSHLFEYWKNNDREPNITKINCRKTNMNKIIPQKAKH